MQGWRRRRYITNAGTGDRHNRLASFFTLCGKTVRGCLFVRSIELKESDKHAMCLLALQYQLVPDSPVLVAANREEYYDRPSLPPSIQSGKPRVLCGIDQRGGGTWLGVNQNGMFVGVCKQSYCEPAFSASGLEGFFVWIC